MPILTRNGFFAVAVWLNSWFEAGGRSCSDGSSGRNSIIWPNNSRRVRHGLVDSSTRMDLFSSQFEAKRACVW